MMLKAVTCIPCCLLLLVPGMRLLPSAMLAVASSVVLQRVELPLKSPESKLLASTKSCTRYILGYGYKNRVQPTSYQHYTYLGAF